MNTPFPTFSESAFFFPTPVNIRRLIASLSIAAGLCGVAAQDKPPNEERPDREITLLRIQYERNWIAASLKAVKKQLLAVTDLEKHLAAARDYDGAIAAREQARHWQAELLRLSHDLELLQSREYVLKAEYPLPSVSLPLEAAKLSGVVHQGSMLTGWAKAGASATWKLPKMVPGGYEVVLRYRCGPLEGGSITVKESHFSLTAPVETTLRGPERRNLGTLKVSEGTTSITLTAASVVKDNLMQLLDVELIPACN